MEKRVDHVSNFSDSSQLILRFVQTIKQSTKIAVKRFIQERNKLYQSASWKYWNQIKIRAGDVKTTLLLGRLKPTARNYKLEVIGFAVCMAVGKMVSSTHLFK